MIANGVTAIEIYRLAENSAGHLFLVHCTHNKVPSINLCNIIHRLDYLAINSVNSYINYSMNSFLHRFNYKCNITLPVLPVYKVWLTVSTYTHLDLTVYLQGQAGTHVSSTNTD